MSDIARTQIGDAWFDTTTRAFEPTVPEDVFMEVRRNMARDGWKYRSTTEIEVNGVAVKVQHYQRPADGPAEGSEDEQN